MWVEVVHEAGMRLTSGAAVTAASAIAPFGDGWLVVQDDATHAAWHRPGGITPVRVLPAVDGHEVFSSAAGTKHLFDAVAGALGTPHGQLNLEGACRFGDRLRWFQRANPAGIASARIDVELAALLEAVTGRAGAGTVGVGTVHRYDLGTVHGVPLAVTDAVALPGSTRRTHPGERRGRGHA